MLSAYERAGLLPAASRTGYRDHDETDLQRLAFIATAQAAGLTVAEIRSVASTRDHAGARHADMVSVLDARAEELDRRIAELMALREQLRHLPEQADVLYPPPRSQPPASRR